MASLKVNFSTEMKKSIVFPACPVRPQGAAAEMRFSVSSEHPKSNQRCRFDFSLWNCDLWFQSYIPPKAASAFPDLRSLQAKHGFCVLPG
jgi:hypothetical protein